MKRILSCILIIVLMLSLTACGEVKKAETAVTEMMDSFKALDYEKAHKHITEGNVKDYEPAYRLTGKDATMFMDNLFGDLEYKIVSSEKVDSKTVNVTTEITAIEMMPILAEFFYNIIEDSKDDPEAWQDEETTFSKMDEIFEWVASQGGFKTVTNKVTIKVVKDGEKWKIAPDPLFVDALFGGFEEAAAEINNVFAQ